MGKHLVTARRHHQEREHLYFSVITSVIAGICLPGQPWPRECQYLWRQTLNNFLWQTFTTPLLPDGLATNTLHASVTLDKAM
ncbi:hypothetical protein PCANC_16188 [Puccinia coronata f. sp. avenae]|uniref:Uncharacterized protein n=1 Tax=Puccinia coronata f. sp. avenae TaxID=200324 RepID=A0A2N5UF83_9BASI|nr:hypothetical protein PCANC_16188 [Puccinia coronata f. sp. avenae]